jgi:hypothetical protein
VHINVKVNAHFYTTNTMSISFIHIDHYTQLGQALFASTSAAMLLCAGAPKKGAATRSTMIEYFRKCLICGVTVQNS